MVNVMAPWLLMKLLRPKLLESPAPRVVNTSSVAATLAAPLDLDNMQGEKEYVFDLSSSKCYYAISKLLVSLLTRHAADTDAGPPRRRHRQSRTFIFTLALFQAPALATTTASVLAASPSRAVCTSRALFAAACPTTSSWPPIRQTSE